MYKSLIFLFFVSLTTCSSYLATTKTLDEKEFSVITNIDQAASRNASLDDLSLNVYMGELFGCEEGSDIENYMDENDILVSSKTQYDVICDLVDSTLSHLGEKKFFDYKSFYSFIMKDEVYGYHTRLVSTKFYNVDLLTVNFDIGYSLKHVVETLNLYSSDDNPTLFVLAMNKLSTSRIYDKAMLREILKSGQIIAIILPKEETIDPEFEPYTTVYFPPSDMTDFVRFKLEVDLSDVKITTNIPGLETKKLQFNFFNHDECDFPSCVINCPLDQTNETLCLSIEPYAHIGHVTSYRHFLFPVQEDLDYIGAVFTSPPEPKKVLDTSYPTWFLKWLLKDYLYLSTVKFNNFLNLFKDYTSYQMSNPILGSFVRWENSGVSSDLVFLNKKNINFVFKITSGDRTPLPYFRLPECYHIIKSKDSKDKCLKYSVLKV